MLFPTIFCANFADNFVANIANFVRDIFLHIVNPEIFFFAKCDQSSQDGLSAWVRPGYGVRVVNVFVWAGESVSLEDMHSENIWLTGSEPPNTCVLCPWIR